MVEEWFYTLPDFENRDKWSEDRPMDSSADESFSKVIVSSMGSAPDHLYIGLAIRRRNRSDNRMIVDSFHLTNGRGVFILRWWIEGDEERFGIAAKLPDGSWRVRSPDEVPCWILTYDQKKKRMRGFGLTFKKVKKGEYN